MQGWLGWYHVTSWTYGQWLRGDPRGWRARHHREHCAGDYKHRPDPADHADQLRLSKALMKRQPVTLAAGLRGVVVDAVAARLIEFGGEPLAASMGAKHLHVLAKFPDDDARVKTGIAKQGATTTLKAYCETERIDLGLSLGQGIWAKRSHAEPVTGRGHQLSTLRYVVGHADEGAAVWLAPAIVDRFDALLKAAREVRGRARR